LAALCSAARQHAQDVGLGAQSGGVERLHVFLLAAGAATGSPPKARIVA
jgi:hypothetical protein